MAEPQRSIRSPVAPLALIVALGCSTRGSVGTDGPADPETDAPPGQMPPNGGAGGAAIDVPPTISVRDAYPVLGDTEARVWVSLSHAYGETITVRLETIEGTAKGDPNGTADFVPVDVMITIPAGATEPSQPITIPVRTPYDRLTLDTSLSRQFATRLFEPSTGTLADAEGIVFLGAAGMVIETPLAPGLGEVDVVDDFNGDGQPDVLLSGTSGQACLLLTPGTRFTEGQHVVVDNAYLDGVRGFSWPVATGNIPAEYAYGDHGQAIDANGDDYRDVVVLGEGQAHILYGQPEPVANFTAGDPRLADGVHATRLADIRFGYGAGPILTGDWNADGVVDFAQAHFYSSVLGGTDELFGFFGPAGSWGTSYTSSDTFSFQSGTTPVGVASLASGTSDLGRADLNDDGIDDIVFVAAAANDGQFGGNYLYARFGDGSMFTGTSLPVKGTLDGSNGFEIRNDAYFTEGSFSPQDAGDVNGDGIDDLVLTSGGAAMSVIFGRSSPFPPGSYERLRDMGPTEAAFFNTDAVRSARIGDLNADGIGDVVFVTENKLRILWGEVGLTGKEIFGTQYPDMGELDIDPESGLDRVGLVADLDRDGADDVVVLSDRWNGAGAALVVFGKTLTPTLGGPEIEPPR